MRIKFQQVFYSYIIFVLWGLGTFLITRFLPPMPIGLMIAVFFMVFAPGFAIGRLLRLDLENTLDKIIASMTIGFTYTWLLGFAAILLGLNLSTLTIIWLGLLGILFTIALFKDIKQTPTETPKLKLKDIFNLNNLIYLLVFAVAFLILMYLVRTGALFKGGDANYHLATLRKVIGDQPLTIHNLNYARDKMLIVYGFPVWHIFLGLAVKLAHSNIFIVWRDMAATLLGLAMLVWYWLARKILPNRDMAVIAFSIFALVGFYWGPAFVYSSFPIPHTFTQLLLLPLAVGLSLIYIYDRPNWKLLIIIILLILTGSAVHITFYFYLLTILISFFIFYAALGWSRADYKKVLQRLATIISLQIVIILPLALMLELKGHAVSNYFKIFQAPTYQTNVKYDSLAELSEFSLYAYVGLPLVLAFTKRYQKLIMIFSVLLVVPVIYFTLLQNSLSRLVGFVYVKRLYGNLDWNFLVWALVVGFILILIDRLIFRLSHLGKFYRWVVNILFGLGASFLFYWQARANWAGMLWQKIFDGSIYNWVAENYLWLMIILIFISVAIFVWQIKQPKIQEFFNLEDAKLPLARFFLVSIFVLILVAPEWTLFKTYLFSKSGPQFFYRSMTPITKVKADTYSNSIGGAGVTEFINLNIPSKSVFDTNSGYFYLPIMVDQHMPIYQSTANTEHRDLYSDETTLARRLDILHRYSIDYILVKPPKEGKSIIESLPQYFTKIYDGKFTIYQVNKDQVKKDYVL